MNIEHYRYRLHSCSSSEEARKIVKEAYKDDDIGKQAYVILSGQVFKTIIEAEKQSIVKDKAWFLSEIEKAHSSTKIMEIVDLCRDMCNDKKLTAGQSIHILYHAINELKQMITRI